MASFALSCTSTPKLALQCKHTPSSRPVLQSRQPRNLTAKPVHRSKMVASATNGTAVQSPPKIEVIKKDTIEVLKDFTAFDLDQYVAGKSKTWTFWNCEPSTFPWDYGAVEHAFILQGKFSVQYEGADPVTLVAGDFVKFPVGKTTFVVIEPTRKFFNLAT